MPILRFLFFCLWLSVGLTQSGWAAEGKGVKLVAWNVQNYAPLPTVERLKPAKSEASAAAVAETIRELAPDIVALCEMGGGEQFAEFQRRLASAGLDYPHAELVKGADAHRHLALLSRYPIASRQSLEDVDLLVNGVHEKMRRGILDVTLLLPGDRPLRILGVHLKSKLELRDENEALLRRMEAYRLRKHIDQILTAEPKAALLLYGDFNDTRDQIAVREIAGERGKPTALAPLPLADPQGDRWTHHWSVADAYTRIDYVMASRALAPRVDREASFIYRTPEWRTASDHRPLVVIFKPDAFPSQLP